MTKEQFLKIRTQHIGDRNRCAELIGMNYRAVLRYESGDSAIPGPVAIIMRFVDYDPTIIEKIEMLSKLD